MPEGAVCAVRFEDQKGDEMWVHVGRELAGQKKQIDQNHSKLNSDYITIRTGCIAEDCLESLIPLLLPKC